MTRVNLFLLAGFLVVFGVSSSSGSEPLANLIFDDSSYVRMAHETIMRTRQQLRELIHDSLSYVPDIYLVNDSDRFQTLIGGQFPDWGAAAALPYMKRIVIKSPALFNLRRPFDELLAHEYSHLVLAERTGWATPPRWLDEGLAMLVSREWGWSDNLAMSYAAIAGRLIPLKEIRNVNRFNATRAHVAYAESYLAVQYLFKEYSVEAANLLLDHIRKGDRLDVALMAATGSNSTDFESEFELYLGKRFNLLTLLVDTMWFWFALALVVVVGAILKYRQRRAYYRRWRQEERFQSTDFDYGDPDNPEQIDDEDRPWLN